MLLVSVTPCHVDKLHDDCMAKGSALPPLLRLVIAYSTSVGAMLVCSLCINRSQ